MVDVVAQGVDYASGRPSAQDVLAADYSFVARYLSDPSGQWKVIGQAEYSDMDSHGVGVVLVFEAGGPGHQTRALAGFGAGVQDGAVARDAAAALGFPDSRPIYFAVDFDVTSDQDSTVDAYLQGVASVVGGARVGVYGSHRYTAHSLDNGVVWAWAADAWGGQLDPRARLVQRVGPAQVAGVACDLDEAVQADFGQHNYQEANMTSPQDVAAAILDAQVELFGKLQDGSEGDLGQTASVRSILGWSDNQHATTRQAVADAQAAILAKLDEVKAAITAAAGSAGGTVDVAALTKDVEKDISTKLGGA